MSETQLSTNTKRIQFTIGLIGWFLVNGLIWLFLGTWGLLGEFAGLENLLIFPANILCLIILSAIRRTRWIGLGILAAWVINLIVATIFGMFWYGACLLPFYVQKILY